MFENPQTVLIAGASGGLAQAIGAEIVRRHPQITLMTLSRITVDMIPGHTGERHHLSVSLEEAESIDIIENFMAEHSVPPDWVINCCGILHDDFHGPEKSLSQCDDHWLIQSMQINVLSHLHLARALDGFLQRRLPVLWVSLSAKVGSIGDNQLGGWYSYRISKAALNMLVKNLSIEWARKLEDSCVVAIHPGTTDTSLSKPFQSNLHPDKLYAPELSAKRIVDVLSQLSTAETGQLLFWDGSQLPW
ncbi:SDR family NAD(P)-dependent oxidoreductase [Microbulbifer sp. OS29]|uniref:SDR family NAD(P)-dependent oxidoreductase n=1 Tax=Microbulbifer okhotskensis TaxID=2926617 RepID=A0A9X2J510_9GAMM|nr:SDR family NAD(P)-dependent oxidoreductase [Microbulbifer okhotskensis]MCO1333854.1 SDR family NAD(P)-dependent oxidoreductase [Microbulbifer okhotskensis]